MRRVYYDILKVILLLLLVVFLFAFTNNRNRHRNIAEPEIKFLGEDNLYITHETVSKLLIQNQQGVTDKAKEIIDLNQLEMALNSNQMIKNAEVFLSIEGTLTAEIEQKRPIARVNSTTSFYIDDEGGVMPLSNNYTARVPLVTGLINKNNINSAFQFARVVDSDDFLKKQVVEIIQNQNGTVDFKIRKAEVLVRLGSLDQLEKKINNFKAFYQKAVKDNILNNYSILNLKFDEQVIGTKK